MSTVNKPYNFANGTPADANQVNSDFDTLYNLVNGNLDQSNFKPGAFPQGVFQDVMYWMSV